MELSADLFEEITGIRPTPARAEDRRRGVRTPLLSRATIYPDETGIGHCSVVLMQDVSVLGVAFEHGERLAAGDEFVLQLPRHWGDPIIIVCVVKRCQVLAPGRSYLVGAMYLRFCESEATLFCSRTPIISQSWAA